MTLCQEAHPETCRSVDAICDCDLCKRVGTGKFWHCVACDCLPCSLARAVERHLYGTALVQADGTMTHTARPRFIGPYHGEPVTPPQTDLDRRVAVEAAQRVAVLKRVPAAQEAYDSELALRLGQGWREDVARASAESLFFAVRDAPC